MFFFVSYHHIPKLECGTWYHHPRRLQCVLNRNLRILIVATWHYWCRHNLKNNCIWDNLQCCLLVPRSPSKHVMLTFDLQSWKVLFIEIVLWHVKPRKTIMILWHLLTRHCPCNLLPEPTSHKHEYRDKLWDHPVTSTMTSSQNKFFFCYNLGRSFHIWGQIEAGFNISKFSK